MNETNREIIQARLSTFMHNVGDLWLQANNDQRILLVVLAAFCLSFFVLAVFVVRWRIIYRREIQKSRHFASMRGHLKTVKDD